MTCHCPLAVMLRARARRRAWRYGACPACPTDRPMPRVRRSGRCTLHTEIRQAKVFHDATPPASRPRLDAATITQRWHAGLGVHPPCGFCPAAARMKPEPYAIPLQRILIPCSGCTLPTSVLVTTAGEAMARERGTRCRWCRKAARDVPADDAPRQRRRIHRIRLTVVPYSESEIHREVWKMVDAMRERLAR